MEQPNKFKHNKRFEGNPRSNRTQYPGGKLRPLAIKTRLENAIEGVDQPDAVTKGKATFKSAIDQTPLPQESSVQIASVDNINVQKKKPKKTKRNMTGDSTSFSSM